MIICIDVGNTTILFGTYDNEKLIDTYRMETKILKTSDEYGSSLLAHYQINDINKKYNKKNQELTAYKLFYVGCSRARKNLYVIVDDKKITKFKDSFICKAKETGFDVIDETTI